MEKEICSYYKPNGIKDRLCRYFTGDKGNKRQIALCRHNCSIIKPTKRDKIKEYL